MVIFAILLLLKFYLEVAMEAVIQRWGNDFGIRIPVGAAKKMSLKTGYRVFIVPLEQKSKETTPRKGWAKAFQKTKKKEKMLIPQTIVNSDFEWEW